MTLFYLEEFNAEKLHYTGILVCDLQASSLSWSAVEA
jgi:hypothetical protein